MQSAPRDQARRRHSGLTDEGLFETGETTAETQSIDLNHATESQLLEVEGFDSALAHTLVEWRTHHGHFESWDDVAGVPDLTDELVRALRRATRLPGPEKTGAHHGTDPRGRIP